MAEQTSNPLASRKLFIQMSGAPGSGKSTLAELLSNSINGAVFDHDLHRSALLDQFERHSRGLEKKGIFDYAAKTTYSDSWKWAQQMVGHGQNFNMDSACNFENIVEGMSIAQQYGYEYWYVECRVEDINVSEARLAGRNILRSQRTSVYCPPMDAVDARDGEDYRKVFEGWLGIRCRPDSNVIIVVDSTRSLREYRDEILARMNGSEPGRVDVQ
ncbi:MAG: hypothetical protein Q9159_005835 [Coniocarpon cinnabarinum]